MSKIRIIFTLLFCTILLAQTTDRAYYNYGEADPQAEHRYFVRRIDVIGFAPNDAEDLVSALHDDLTAEDLVTEGLAIDYTNGAGTGTFAFDPTELLGNVTWGDGSTDTIVWTWNRATGTDPVITFNSGSINLQALTLDTPLLVPSGGTGLASITDHGVMVGSATGAVTPTAVGATGDVLTGNTGADPTFKTPTVDVPVDLHMHTEKPSRSSETNWLGGVVELDNAAAVNGGAPFAMTAKGIGKIIIVINAGGDLIGDITAKGLVHDRNTGATTPGGTSVITIDGITTDSSTTDTNTNVIHGFTKAYISDKWFSGVVTLTTADTAVTDMDIFHVSFHQYNDKPNITVQTFDCSLYTTGVAAEFDAYFYDIHVTGDECTIEMDAELHIGADGETALVNKYWRLRRGNLNESLDGTTDGVWVDIFYSNSPVQIEDVTILLLATETITVDLN